MKYTFFLFFLSFSLFYSCKPAECNKPCENGGTCVEGQCECPEGFTGLYCDVELEPCQQVQYKCENGTCDNSTFPPTCICDDGWEGAKCEKAWTDKFLGTWQISSTCRNGNFVIKEGSKGSTLIFEGMHYDACSPSAKIVGQLLSSTVFEIKPQPMCFGTITGSGGMNSDKTQIYLDYQIVENTDTLRCSAVWMK